MFAVVSHLDREHEALVRGLWEELERQYCVRQVYQQPVAHVSYLVFASKPAANLKRVMESFVAEHEPFEVCAGGLGLFPGTPAVLYVPVVRSAQLTCFHNALWQAFGRKILDTSGYYCPERWIPHITLAHVNLRSVNFGQMIADLSERRLDWRCRLDDLALIHTDGGGWAAGLNRRLGRRA